ncbi:hsp70 nucleotide exchange factor fes1 [Exophiala xenobiotica]|uniref:Hsp70 nucleotide exchange factor FES1 n=1 Tax=Lithohypha guttulata TaxID=1690604 RepID=A0ABR0JWD5_9EURO|nr:hsp70 nucleotide exchange factor fes1 [Lithohypha guttulata]KAK5317256.1 hsp70 nucleotide exchange factor fes1 [Exophiala xenobiotica]
MDKGMSNLLAWSIENSPNAQAQNPDATAAPTQPVYKGEAPRGLNEADIRALMGGPSDADLLKEAMHVVVNPQSTLDAKMIAFDNFEQLIENLDNAMNLAPIGLWAPLLNQLDNTEASLRKMAAWCIGTAVQNNEKCQAHLLSIGGVPKVAKMAVEDDDDAARRKAVYALSSTVRNFQPGMDEAMKTLPKNITGPDAVNAADMDVIDAIMEKLREG